MASALNIIKNFMDSLNNTKKSGTSALDEAVKSVSNFKSWSNLINTMITDCSSYNGNGDAFLKKMCGINLSNSDTGAITGSDAGGGSTKTKESIVPESGAWKYPSKTSFKIQGLTVTVPKKNTLNASKQYIVGALYTWWIKNSLTLIKNSYGLSFTDKNASVKKIEVSFYDRDDGKVASVSYGSSRKTTTLSMKINMNYFKNIDTKNPNGVGSSQTLTYLDRTIVHELTHAVMAANVDYFSKLPTAFKEGSAELVHGIDDKRTADIKKLASNSTDLKKAVNSNGINSYSAGYIALRYLAKQAASNRKISSNIIEDYSEQNFVTSNKNNFSESTAADELFDENISANNNSLDEIISTQDFSVANVENNQLNNFIAQNEDIFKIVGNSQKNYVGEN